VSKEKYRITLDMIIDRELNPADPPNMWDWSNLLDLGRDESVQLVKAEWHGTERSDN
jgi:hypothetical protein